MKVTDKKFLNVHQTIGPLTVASVNVTSSNSKDGTNSSASTAAASGKADKLLVSLDGLLRIQQNFGLHSIEVLS